MYLFCRQERKEESRLPVIFSRSATGAQNDCAKSLSSNNQFATNCGRRQPDGGGGAQPTSVQSAAKLIDQPENQANDHADDQTGDERKIKCAMLAAMNDVSGQAAKAERKLWTQIEKRSDEDEHGSDGEQQTTELLNGFHRDPVANAWFLTFQPAEAKTTMGGERN
jgi:hypothetical protein